MSDSRFDWRGGLAVLWVAWFGTLYIKMVLEQRAPMVLEQLRAWFSG